MPKSANQKAKLLYLAKILLENTDEDHTLSIAQLIEALSDYGISAERKSIYSDIEELNLFGLDIESIKTKEHTGYYIACREFELPELKLLVDAVQASKFITHKKSEELIGKISRLASRHQAHELERQVVVMGRIKNINESIYYNVDYLQNALWQKKPVTFSYFDWNTDKERVLRHNGEKYTVSPYALTWDDDNYYMIGFDSKEKKTKHFRVDKMLSISILDSPREGEEEFFGFDPAKYSKMHFGMFGGEEEYVTLLCDNRLSGVIIDRFGQDIVITKRGDKFETVVRVVTSPQFFSWIFGLSGAVTVTAPEKVKEKYKKMLKLCADNIN